MIKVVHLTDLHLRSANRQKAVDSIIFAHSELWENKESPAYSPDLVLVTGDVTDHSIALDDPDLGILFNFIGACVCPIVFLQGTPSHEPPEILRRIAEIACPRCEIYNRPLIFQSPAVSETLTANGAVSLAALPAITPAGIQSWVDREMGVDAGRSLSLDGINALIRENLPNILRGFAVQWKDFQGPKILIAHTTVATAKEASGYARLGDDIEVTLADLALAEADAVLLGHIHRAQEWTEFGLVSYGGSSHPVNWGENDQKSFGVYHFPDCGGNTVIWKRIPYPHLPLVKFELEFTGQTENTTIKGDQVMIDDKSVGDHWTGTFESWSFLINGEERSLIGFCQDLVKPAAVRVRYIIPDFLRDKVDNNYILSLVQAAGLDPDNVTAQRIIKSQSRRQAIKLHTGRTAWEMYSAACEANQTQPRPGVQAKAASLELESKT